MDELSNLSKSLGSAGAADVGATMGDLAGAIDETGGVDGLVDKLRAGGLDQEVDSWVSTGANQPVDPQRLGAALGPETTQRLANRGLLGRSAGDLGKGHGYVRRQVDGLATGAGVIIPRKGVAEISKVLETSQEPVRLSLDGTRSSSLRATHGTTTCQPSSSSF